MDFLPTKIVLPCYFILMIRIKITKLGFIYLLLARLKELLKVDKNKFKLISHGTGKFGRVLGDIEISVGNVCDILVEEGHAYSYFGGNKEEARAKAAEILAESNKVSEKGL